MNAEAPAPWSPVRPLPAEFHARRLTIRWWQPEDAPGMLEALDADRASYLPWLPWTAVDNKTVPQCIFQIEKMRRTREVVSPTPTDFTMGIFDRASGAPVGGTGLHRISVEHHQGEIGYWVRPDRRGQGLCTEMVAGLITWSLRPQDQGGWGLRRIEIRCGAGNLASQSVPRKLGVREEARLVKERWVNGRGWEDTLVFGVLAEEWPRELRA